MFVLNEAKILQNAESRVDGVVVDGEVNDADGLVLSATYKLLFTFLLDFRYLVIARKVGEQFMLVRLFVFLLNVV